MPTLDPLPKTIQSIYAWYSEDKLFVNRRYQRKLVWTQIEKQKLIESITSQYPVPAILLAERPDGSFEIIDGLQRLFSIVSFIENSYPTVDGKLFDVAQFPTAKLRSDDGHFVKMEGEKLNPREVSTFLDYSMAITVMRNATEGEIDDVFARINTYGHRLSDQERRQSGVQDSFSEAVRELACLMRGDVSKDVLRLDQMPSISIDLPMNRHGYDVKADEVFWVSQGVLRSTELRDSVDEQCIADIAACVVGGSLIERSKSALDEIYERDSEENRRIAAALDVYGAQRFSDEFKFCVDEILKVCAAGEQTRLRNLLFTTATTNAFPSVFAILLIAFHEALIGGDNKIANYGGVKTALTGLADTVVTSRKATSRAKRRQNIEIVKGLLAAHLAPGALTTIYGSNAVADIDAMIRQQSVEMPHYELKQGILTLAGSGRGIDQGMIPKLVRTICAIANNGKTHSGSIVIGVADKLKDAQRALELDGVPAREVGKRYVVGVNREAKFLGETAEQYYGRIKQGIRDSGLSEPLKTDVLSSTDYNEYFGLGVIVIAVPLQRAPSTVDGKMFRRDGDETVEVTDVADIVAVTQRFA
jgi:hypothetical protein